MLILPGFVAQSSRWFAALTPHCDAVPHVAVAQGAGATPPVLAAPPANHQVLREIPAPWVCCCCCAPSTSFGRRGRGLGGGVQWGLHAHFFLWRHPRLQSPPELMLMFQVTPAASGLGPSVHEPVDLSPLHHKTPPSTRSIWMHLCTGTGLLSY